MFRVSLIIRSAALFVLVLSVGPRGLAGQTLTPQDIRARNAAAAAEQQAEQRRQYDAELSLALPDIDRLVASDKLEDRGQALAALTAAARKFDKAGGPHPIIQSRLGQTRAHRASA
jgi:hypothetical protein